MSLTAIERAKRIKIILFDVDGVLTDGTIWVHPTGEKTPGVRAAVEPKGFNAHDGTSISLAKLAGLKTGVITKRISDTVAIRAKDLKLEFCYMGQSYKMQAVREILAQTGAVLDEVAYVGDDIIDLPVMRQCGFAVAVANARAKVKEAAHYVTPSKGGEGAARDAVEFILEAQGVLDAMIESYIDEENPMAPSNDIGKGGF